MEKQGMTPDEARQWLHDYVDAMNDERVQKFCAGLRIMRRTRAEEIEDEVQYRLQREKREDETDEQAETRIRRKVKRLFKKWEKVDEQRKRNQVHRLRFQA